MRARTLSLAILTPFLLGTAGCSVLADDENGDDGGPLTVCIYNYLGEVAGKDFGESCTSDSECAFGECMQPGDTGNITNDTFGFCTRGCDCNNDEASQLDPDVKEVLECLYPPGNPGSDRHVVIQCTSVDDCTAVDSGWTDCATSDGTVQKVCKAL